MLRYYMCLRIQHTSKECCVRSKTLFQGKTGSKCYCIYPFERTSTIFKKCSTILCNMPNTLSKEYCIHLRTFFRGKTLSNYYNCIYWRILRHRNSTFFYKMPHWPQLVYAMSPVLFDSNTASNEGLSLQARFFQSPAASIEAFCYKAMLHVLKEIPHHSPQSIQQCLPGTYILCLTMSNLDRNVYERIQGSEIPRFAQKLLEIEQESAATVNFQVHKHHSTSYAKLSLTQCASSWERSFDQNLTSQDR